ncbi:flagellar hook-associated protein FlgK [Sphingopyxis sp. PET50]|uniref:flagellar hook-associated protein FlgK n=1 Tax=Sphingopyxis sp. PET50 TaxID=2976533 RepID=UPI0021AFB2D4|nr:flagellar hook-associated protein FlgK [Sphingopyxis sp. PET50]
MTDLLSIGASGLKAYSRAMSTVGDNIANAQTPGYARRTLALKEMASGTESALVGRNVSPGGVTIRGITRSVDKWLIEDARTSAGEAQRAATRADWMTKVESALSDDANGISTNLTKLFTTADQLTADPNNVTLRAQFLQSAADVATGFRTSAAQLDSMSQGVSDAAQASVADLNTDLDALESVNAGLRKARAGSTNEASLLDERDRLIDQIASQMPVTASFDDKGAVTLRAAGSGDMLVGNATVTHVAVTVAADGQLGFSAGGAAIDPASGNLAGLGQAADHIADQRAGLDAAAAQFAGQLNAAHQAGTDANGNAGQPLFTGATAATLTATSLSAAQVAAANGSGTNGNMLAIGAMRGADDPEAAWTARLASQAQATASARAQDAAATTRADGAIAARDNVSGVDLDQEAADLLRFQQAYSAAARTIQVARETMQALLSAI